MSYRYIVLPRKTYDANDEKEIAAKIGAFQLTKIHFHCNGGENRC